MVQLETGTRLGRYELLIELGQGGMASVWVAREYSRATRRQRLVALKIMLPKLATDSTFRSMFLDEGGLVRSIEHDHVVRVYEVAESKGLLYMAMEWVEGDSLRTVIEVAKRRRAIPPEMAVRIIADTASGLHAAHELRGWDGELRGIVHCDVSPHNILIGPTGIAKLVDFGVAHAVAQSELEDRSSDKIKGKFGYMSPEQVQGQKFDRRSDVFGLGIVLFELTTGERLFRGRDATHTLKLVAYGQIPKPSRLIPKYPPALDAIVMKALERDPEKRFQTAAELQQALQRYLTSESILVSHAGVGGLAKRVLSERINQRRTAIRATLAQLGEPSGATELPALDMTVSSEPGLDSWRSGSDSLSVASASMRGAAVLPPGWDLPPSSRRHSSLVYVLAALLLLGAGIGSAYLIVRDTLNERDRPRRATVRVVHQDPPSQPEDPEMVERDDSPEAALTADTRLEDLPSTVAGEPSADPPSKDAGKDAKAADSSEPPEIAPPSREGFDPAAFRDIIGPAPSAR